MEKLILPSREYIYSVMMAKSQELKERYGILDGPVSQQNDKVEEE